MAAGGTSFYLLPLALEKQALADGNLPEGEPGIATSAPPPPFFTDRERKALASLSDQVLPGAAALGAVNYIETLLTAFEFDPPRIFASGPFSGRQPFADGGAPGTQSPPDSFLGFQPLTRMQETGWKLRLYGSAALKEGYWNESTLGSVTGWRDLFKKGIADSMSVNPNSPSLSLTSKEFKTVLKPLVIEGSFCPPEYGGNQGTSGWKLVHYEGDSQPLGYSIYDEKAGAYRERPDHPLSGENPGQDPNKMGFLTRAFCFIITLVQRGKVF